MRTEKVVFICILVLNALAACLYFVWGCMVQKSSRERESRANTSMTRSGYALKSIIMLLCPVVGLLFFALSRLIYLCLFRSEVDLEDVIFGKDKVVAERKAEEERERNRVPLEEALAVCDKNSLRDLMLDIIQGNVDNTLSSIVLALNSEDTETSHYAAAVLRDAFNDFRLKSQEIYNAMERGGRDAAANACLLIEYMNGILSQEVFTDMEQSAFVEMMEEACSYLNESEQDRHLLTCEYLEWLIVRLLHIRRYGSVKRWCEVIEEMYPDELATYTVQLKLYFSTQDRTHFFDVLNRLKQSNIVIDRDTLDLIRVFS